MYNRLPSRDFSSGGASGMPQAYTNDGIQGARALTFYEEARLIVPVGATDIPVSYPHQNKVSLAEVRARNKVRIKT